MNAQVFTTSTSASSAFDVICMPCCSTLPSMISASTRFFAQPRLIMPTFGASAEGRGVTAANKPPGRGGGVREGEEARGGGGGGLGGCRGGVGARGGAVGLGWGNRGVGWYG